MSPGQKFLKRFPDTASSQPFVSMVYRGQKTDEQMRAELEALHQKEEAKKIPQDAPKTAGAVSVGDLVRVRGWLETHAFDRPSSARHEIPQIVRDLQISEASVQKSLARLQDDYDHEKSKGKLSFR